MMIYLFFFLQKEINKGNWDYINNCNKIKNLVELLFLWILKLNVRYICETVR